MTNIKKQIEKIVRPKGELMFPEEEAFYKEQVDQLYSLFTSREREIEKMIREDMKEPTRVAEKHSGYKKGWHWKSLGDAYVRNKYRRQLLSKLKGEEKK